jgi:ceramide glucosyltransferase
MTVLLVGISCFATLYYLFALWCVIAFFSRKPSPSGNWAPPVSILKPVKGLDEEAFENFVSFCRQDYPAYEVLFGVESKEDPAVPMIQRLIQTFPKLDIQLIVVESVHAANQKVGVLAALSQRARHNLLVISDSDIRVPPSYLKEVMAPFQEPQNGMVTCLYRARGAKNLPAALESLMIHLDFFPAVLVAERLEGLRFGLGATMAIRRSALSSIGGFEKISDYLADDYLLGYRIDQAGYRIFLSTLVVDIVQQRLGMAGFLKHQLRWARTYKACRPKGYFASVLTHGVFFSMVYLLTSGFSPLAWILMSATGGVRLLTAALISGRYLKESGWLATLLLVPVKEVLTTVIWTVAFLGNTVVWKDKIFRLEKDGRMIRSERSS